MLFRASTPAVSILLSLCLAGCTASPDDAGDASADRRDPPSQARFTDVTAGSGLEGFRHVTGAFGQRWFPETMGSGCAFVDVDGDGRLDALLVGGYAWPGHGEPPPALSVYRNRGDGTFEDQTRALGIDELKTYGFGLSAADYDNDGDQDIFLGAVGRNYLFRNDGGRLTEVGAAAGLAEPDEWTASAMFFDADRDGWLDLLYVNYVAWSPEKDLPCTIEGKTRSYCTPELYEGTPPRFFHNNGDGTFSDWTQQAGFLPSPGKSLGVGSLDFDRDGWPDVLIANDTEPDQLFHNKGDGTFTEIGLPSGIAFDENGKARGGMGVDAGVVDGSGEVSTFVGNFSKEMIGVYRYVGNGLFLDRAASSRIGRPSLLKLTFSVFLFDADLDGDLDLFSGNGHLQPEIGEIIEGIEYREQANLFLNDGEGVFADAGTEAGSAFEQPLLVRGSAYGDYDGDGDLDILITENGGPAHLWRNDVQSANYLRVHLTGGPSNRDGIGTELIAVSGGRRQYQRVRTGSSYLSRSELTITFGLGDAERVDSLIAAWPAGRVEAWTNLPSNQVLSLAEGSGVPVP